MIKQIYESLFWRTQIKFYDAKYNMANLANVKDEALKSILFAKLGQARHAGIEVAIEIVEPIGLPNMELLDLITLLSIFLDNAIEASFRSRTSEFFICLF